MDQALLQRIQLAFVAIALATQSTATAAPSPKNTTKALVLHQREGVYGQVVATVSPTGLRVDIGNKKYVVARAPEWRVVWYDPNDNTAMDMTYDQYVKHIPHLDYNGSGKPPDRLLEKIGPIDYVGLKCTKLSALATGPDGRINPKIRYKEDFYSLPEHKLVPPQAVAILIKLYGQPDVKGLPLYEKATVRDNLVTRNDGPMVGLAKGVDCWLSTSSAQESAVNPAIFSYPANFKNVKWEIEILSDSASRKQGEDMLKDLQLGK